MSKKKLRWCISRIRGNKAEQLGTVTAADVELAIKEFEVTDKHRQSQLAAGPDA